MKEGKLVVKMQFGSHVYGTAVPTSDTDYKSVHIPPAEDILLQRVKDSFNLKTKADPQARNSADDVDFESFSLQKYMTMLLQGQTVAMDMLFTPDEWLLESSPVWERIRAGKDLWLSSGVSAFVGYCRTQANKYGIRGSRVATARAAVTFFEEMIVRHGHTGKLDDCWDEVEAFVAAHPEHTAIVTGFISGDLPVLLLEVCNRKTQRHAPLKEGLSVYRKMLENYGQRALAAERNEGVDWKATMHAVRVAHQAVELLTIGHITFPRPEAALLLQIRKGELPYRDVAELIEQGMLDVEAAGKASTLPTEPNHGAAEVLVLMNYYDEVARGFAP